MKRTLSVILALLFFFSVQIPVFAKNGISHGAREGKRIALSFDDGPHPSFTPRILEILDKYGITATFFMIGCNVSYYPEVAKAVYKKGHEIGNHTYHHPHMKKLSIEMLKEEVLKTEEVLRQNGIPSPKLFRPPEGFRSAEQVSVLSSLGYQTIIWSVDTRDWQGREAREIVSGVLDDIQGGDILLFHDYTSQRNTITALDQLIPRLLEDGYKFVTVSELMC